MWAVASLSFVYRQTEDHVCQPSFCCRRLRQPSRRRLATMHRQAAGPCVIDLSVTLNPDTQQLLRIRHCADFSSLPGLSFPGLHCDCACHLLLPIITSREMPPAGHVNRIASAWCRRWQQHQHRASPQVSRVPLPGFLDRIPLEVRQQW